ncbi:MAG TPA: homocysteine S-methyltransferase family protein [Marinobacterium sp.]|nr:homocysteine S-methyltransferase family protein [Marinobacterium sp.]
MEDLQILDGGMGHELRRIGAPFSRPLWSAEALLKSPEMVLQVHRSYIESGADIITTNSYACVPFHLGDQLFHERGAQLARLAAELAAKATESVKRPVMVAASLPPAMGSYRPDLFDKRPAQPITRALVDAQRDYVDLWLAETVSSLAEFESTAEVLADETKPVYYSFTLDDQAESPRLRSGELVTEVAQRVCQTGATGLMFNCSVPEIMAAAVEKAKAVVDGQSSSLALGVYANKFTPIKSTQDSRSQEIEFRAIEPDEYLTYAREWRTLGATIIGGCCGIGPEYIRELSRWKRQSGLL